MSLWIMRDDCNFIVCEESKFEFITYNVLKVHYHKAKYLSLHDYLNSSQNNLEGDVY